MLSKMIIPIEDNFREVITIDTDKKEVSIRNQYKTSEGWNFYTGGCSSHSKTITFDQLKNIFKLLLSRAEIMDEELL